MAVITPVSAARAANDVAFAAASAGGDKFANNARKLLMVQHTNGGGSAVTLTIPTSATVDGLAVADRAIVIDPGEFHILGPWPEGTYNDENGDVNLSWSSETDIEVAVLSY